MTPLDEDQVTRRSGQRMVRLDHRPDGWSPITTGSWSPSGAVRIGDGDKP
jgi:hypothetical protein